MKYILLLFCLNLLLPPVFSISVENLEKLFIEKVPKSTVFTKVPRGLIISIDEDFFFDECESAIKESSLYILDEFAEVLKEIPNYCVIENHLNNDICVEDLESWELSAMRSANISEYLVKYNNVPTKQLFDIGFGDAMPFRDNLGENVKKFGNRIDFVLIEYEAMR